MWKKMIDLRHKLDVAMTYCRVNQPQLAKLTSQSTSNLNNKLVRNDFKLSEYQRLVEALGCQLEIKIVLPNGDKI